MDSGGPEPIDWDEVLLVIRDRAAKEEGPNSLPQLDDPPAAQPPAVTRSEQRLIEAAADISGVEAAGDQMLFLHSGLAQLGLPRSPLIERSFQRPKEGIPTKVSLLVTAGSLWDGARWVQQPLPSGTKPRLIMLDLCTRAKLTGDPEVEVSGSARQYMRHLGLGVGGGRCGPLGGFRAALGSLAACRMQIGLTYAGHVVTMDRGLLSGIAQWVTWPQKRIAKWPCKVRIHNDFHESLREYAVPLDRRAIRELSNSALALDIYTWWAQRLHRVRKATTVYWGPLKRFMADEYASVKAFRQSFVKQAHRVKSVYPDAQVEIVRGGLELRNSTPPIRKAAIVNPG